MYSFTDPRVLSMLQKVVTTYSRIGEFITLEARSESLQLSTVNSSQSVVGQVKLVQPLFTGSGSQKTVQVKARALDMVLRRLENDHVSALDLEFTVTGTGHEQVVVVFNSTNGATKEFVLPGLYSAIMTPEFESLGDPFSFECLPSLLREAFASCESSADELQIMFRPNLISLLAQKRGNHARKKAGSIDVTKPAVQPGLKTLIKLQFDSFRQITAQAPRQLDMKFKEFRTMLSFLDYMCDGSPLRAEFSGVGSTTPVVFRGKFAAFPAIQFVFKFVSRFTAPRTPPVTWVRVGPQGAARDARDAELLQREAEAVASFQDEQSILSIRREDQRKARRIERDRASASYPAPPPRFDFEASPSIEEGEEETAPPSPEEVGFTQPPTEVQGLFD